MAEALVTADGKAVPLDDIPADAAFAAAMAAPEPSSQPDYPAPRRRKDPDFPFGKNEDGSPVAPYGIGNNGKPRQNPPGPGRGGAKHEKSRTQQAPAGKSAPVPVGPARDYTADLLDFEDGLWVAMAAVPPTQAQATILKANREQMAAGLNLSAQHNPMVRRGVEYLCSDAGWMINAATMVAPFLLQSAALWFRPAALEQMGTSKDELAATAKKDFEDFIAEQQKSLAETLRAQREELAAEAALARQDVA